jgi:hypothetical protein
VEFDIGTYSTPQAIASGDFNGDGRPDRAAPNEYSVTVLVNRTVLGATVADFGGRRDFAVGDGPAALTVADFDGAGKPDLATANEGGGVSVLVNRTASPGASPTFAPSRDFDAGTHPISVAAGDFDADGRPDLAVGDFLDGTASVLLNALPTLGDARGAGTIRDDDGAPSDGDDQLREARRLAFAVDNAGRIGSAVDVDLYRFSARAGERLYVDVDAVPDGGGGGVTLDSFLRVFDAAGREVARNDNAAAPGDRFRRGESYLSFIAPADGAYFAGVSATTNRRYDPVGGGGDDAGTGPGITGGYVINVQRDLNDQFSEAATLAVGLARTSTIAAPADVDIFRFNVASPGQVVAFDLDRTGGTLDSLLRLFDAAGRELAANDNGQAPGEAAATGASYLEFTFATAGTYFLGVTASRNGAYDPRTGLGDAAGRGTGGYTLAITTPTPAAALGLRVATSRPLPRLIVTTGSDPVAAGLATLPGGGYTDLWDDADEVG